MLFGWPKRTDTGWTTPIDAHRLDGRVRQTDSAQPYWGCAGLRLTSPLTDGMNSPWQQDIYMHTHAHAYSWQNTIRGWHGKKPGLSHLRDIGSHTFALILKHMTDKKRDTHTKMWWDTQEGERHFVPMSTKGCAEKKPGTQGYFVSIRTHRPPQAPAFPKRKQITCFQCLQIK